MKHPRKIIRVIGPSIAYAVLTRGLYSLIDSADADRVEMHCWQANPCTGSSEERYYAQRADGVGLHRFLLNFPAVTVDHKNGNTLDNRKTANLREAKISENQWNVKLRKDSSTGHKGVQPYPRYGCYVARIRVDGKRKFLGYFPTAEQGAIAYQAAANESHGDFHRAT